LGFEFAQGFYLGRPNPLEFYTPPSGTRAT